MAYEKVFNKPYPTWHNSPLTDTPVNAGVLEEYDGTLENIENFLDGSTAVKPVPKTSAMTQQVGVDSNGALYTAPSGGGGGGSASEISYDNTESGLAADDVQEAIDELKVIATSIQPIVKTNAMTQAVGKDANGQLWTEPGISGDFVSKAGDTMTGGLTTPNITVGSRAQNSTVGTNSSSFGANNNVSGEASMAAGANNTVSQSIAGAVGTGNAVNQQGGFAAGIGNVVNGVYAQAFGYSNVVGSAGQLVCGQYNENNSADLFEIGNGSSNLRSNAFSVDNNGDVKFRKMDIDSPSYSLSGLLADDLIIYIELPVYFGSEETALQKITLSQLKDLLDSIS